MGQHEDAQRRLQRRATLRYDKQLLFNNLKTKES